MASYNIVISILLQSLLGALVNGPYTLITTAVSADLGTKVKGNKALATVTAIIDGTGSIGAAIGPFLAGLISDYSWNYVFYMTTTSSLLSLLFLVRVAFNELKRYRASCNHS